MGKFIDLSGKVFGRLVAISLSEKRIAGRTAWNCLCECGNKTIVTGCNLTNGVSKSCGCLQKELASKVAAVSNKTHGMTNSPEFKAWRSMKKRCYQETDISYKNYGGRGIKVCDAWLESFENFYQDMGPRPIGMSLDRKNNSGNYEKNNCRWATKIEQGRNNRANRIINFQGKDYCLSELAEKLGISDQTVNYRIIKGIPLDAKKWGGSRG